MPADTTPTARITTLHSYSTDVGHFTHLRAGHIDFLSLVGGPTDTYKLINTATGETGEVSYRTGRAVLESAARNAAHQVKLARAAYAAELLAA